LPLSGGGVLAANLLACLAGPNSSYWLKSPPTPQHFAALTLNVGLLLLVLIGPMVALHHKGIPFRLALACCVVILATMVNSLRTLLCCYPC